MGVFAKSARKTLGVSQQKMADDLGVSRATLNAFENGRGGDIGVRKVINIFAHVGYEFTPSPVSALPTFESLQADKQASKHGA